MDSEAVVRRCFAGKNLCWSLSKIVLETPAQLFSDEYCQIFKNTDFIEYLWMAASADSIWSELKVEKSYKCSEAVTRRCSLRNCVPKNFAKFAGKYLRQSHQVAGLRPATLLKKRLWHRHFPVNFTKFLRTPFHRAPLGDCFLMLQIRIFLENIFIENWWSEKKEWSTETTFNHLGDKNKLIFSKAKICCGVSSC